MTSETIKGINDMISLFKTTIENERAEYRLNESKWIEEKNNIHRPIDSNKLNELGYLQPMANTHCCVGLYIETKIRKMSSQERQNNNTTYIDTVETLMAMADNHIKNEEKLWSEFCQINNRPIHEIDEFCREYINRLGEITTNVVSMCSNFRNTLTSSNEYVSLADMNTDGITFNCIDLYNYLLEATKTDDRILIDNLELRVKYTGIYVLDKLNQLNETLTSKITTLNTSDTCLDNRKRKIDTATFDNKRPRLDLMG